MVIPVIAREAVRLLARGLAVQDKVINSAYSRPFLSQNVNRAAVRGIRHGLSGGAVGGGLYEGFITPSSIPDTDAPFQSPFKQPFKTGRFNKTRSRYAVRRRSRCPDKHFNSYRYR